MPNGKSRYSLLTTKYLKNEVFYKIPSQKFVYKQFNAYLCHVNSKFTQKRTTNCFLTY
jgi:hypothetical protein